MYVFVEKQEKLSLNYLRYSFLSGALQSAFECHRKVKQNETLCHLEDLGSMPVFIMNTGMEP